MATSEYLMMMLEKTRPYVPEWIYAELQKAARAKAAMSGRTADRAPTYFEKMALTEITPRNLASASGNELKMAWLRLHQWYASAKRRGDAIEDYVNGALFVMGELRRRGLEYNDKTDLAREALKLREKADKAARHIGDFDTLPNDLVVVRDFASVVGSAATDKENPGDVDVLLRANRTEDGNNFLIQSENLWLPLRKVLTPQKDRPFHVIDNPQGAHADYVPLYDLVLRKKRMPERVTIKEDSGVQWDPPIKVDLGCGEFKIAQDYLGIDAQPYPGVDVVHDLEEGIPLPDESVIALNARHFLEHVEDKEAIMEEIWRVLVPGGMATLEVPSTSGEGAFAHPGHRSWWNKTSFVFWTQPDMLEGRPKFDLVGLDEETVGDRVYVKATLQKPVYEEVEKAAFTPYKRFTPPKPAMSGFTELARDEVDKLWNWAKNRLPVDVEPKFNGFRGILEKHGDAARLWYEGQYGKDELHKFPEIQKKIKAIDGDFVLDVDVGIMGKDGKRFPRIRLLTLNADKPVFEDGSYLKITLFDLPYYMEDMTGQTFEQRRHALEGFYGKDFQGDQNFGISPIKWVDTETELAAAAEWAFDHDMSEGLVAKSADGHYELDGATTEWSKLKRVAELKVIVLDKIQTRTPGTYNYRGGLAMSQGATWTNAKEFRDGNRYVDLGETFNSQVKADVGDVITVEVLELIPDYQDRKLAWLGARVIDRDATRKEPYSTEQSLDIARRFGVIQEVPASPVSKEDVVALAALGYEARTKVHKAKAMTGEEGGETRGTAALQNWQDNWVHYLPTSGKGRFVYQHHWRGLPEADVKMTEDQLLRTDHSLHGDLRLEGNDALWGFSVFLGRTADNLKVGGDRLEVLKPDDALQGGFKLPQPKAWLDVGAGGPDVVEPGGVGSTSLKYSKFFREDHGTYQVGYAKESFIEIFLDGQKLKGRFLLQRIPFGRREAWVIARPNNQTPFIESHSLDAEIADQKSKNRKWIYWSAPGQKPKIIDLSKETVRKDKPFTWGDELKVSLFKAEDEKRLVYGEVLIPETIDAQGEIISADEIEKTAHNYLAKYRIVGYRHSRKAKAVPVESYIAPVDFRTDSGTLVKKGTWILVGRIDDEKTWQDVKDGKLNGWSIGGYSYKDEV